MGIITSYPGADIPSSDEYTLSMANLRPVPRSRMKDAPVPVAHFSFPQNAPMGEAVSATVPLQRPPSNSGQDAGSNNQDLGPTDADPHDHSNRHGKKNSSIADAGVTSHPTFDATDQIAPPRCSSPILTAFNTTRANHLCSTSTSFLTPEAALRTTSLSSSPEYHNIVRTRSPLTAPRARMPASPSPSRGHRRVRSSQVDLSAISGYTPTAHRPPGLESFAPFKAHRRTSSLMSILTASGSLCDKTNAGLATNGVIMKVPQEETVGRDEARTQDRKRSVVNQLKEYYRRLRGWRD